MLSVDATTASYLLHCLWMLHEYKRKVGRNQMKYASLMKHGNHLYLAAYCNVYVQCECRLLVIIKSVSNNSNKKHQTLDMKKVFYTGYISSIIEYACIVWGIGNKTNSNRIIKLQKRAARIVLKIPFKISSKLMFNELK